MKVYQCKIGPKDAEELLKMNTRNRPVREFHVDRLAGAMSRGLWKPNGDTITVSGNILIDGQHRLLAIVKSGVTIDCIMVEGVAPDTFDTKDTGRRRSGADTLAVQGETHCKTLAAALLMIDRYMTGRLGRFVHYTTQDVSELVRKYPEARRSVAFCKYTKIIPGRIVVAMHYLFSRKDEALADQFVEQLYSGCGLTSGDPVYLLRERLTKNASSKAKLSTEYIIAIIIKAWNYTRDGLKMKNLSYREEGDTPERFPVIK